MTALLRRLRVVALALLLVPLAASAQDRPDAAARLAHALDLTEAQAEIVERHLDGDREPGALWRLSADLAPTLSEAQREALLAPPERPAMRGDRRGPRADRPGRQKGGARGAHREEARAAAREALNLSDEQAAALEGIRAAHRAQRQARRPAPGEIPAELEELLTPDQQAVWQVHRGLAQRLRFHHGRRARG